MVLARPRARISHAHGERGPDCRGARHATKRPRINGAQTWIPRRRARGAEDRTVTKGKLSCSSSSGAGRGRAGGWAWDRVRRRVRGRCVRESRSNCSTSQDKVSGGAAARPEEKGVEPIRQLCGGLDAAPEPQKERFQAHPRLWSAESSLGPQATIAAAWACVDMSRRRDGKRRPAAPPMARLKSRCGIPKASSGAHIACPPST